MNNFATKVVQNPVYLTPLFHTRSFRLEDSAAILGTMEDEWKLPYYDRVIRVMEKNMETTITGLYRDKGTAATASPFKTLQVDLGL